jgi:hypothetical protein
VNLLDDILVIIFYVIILNFVVSTILMKIAPIAILFCWLKIFILRFKQLVKFLFKAVIEVPKFNAIAVLILFENFLSNFAFFVFGSLLFFLIRLIFNTDVFDYDDIINLYNHFTFFFLKSELYPINSFISLKFCLLQHYFNLYIILKDFL